MFDMRFWVSKWQYLKQICYASVLNNNESDIANLSLLFNLMGQIMQNLIILKIACSI